MKVGTAGQIAALLLLCAAEPVPAPKLSAPESWVPRQGARLIVLDKLSAEAHMVTVAVGQSTQLGSLTIALKACEVRPPDLPADAAALLTIHDSNEGAPGFDGWMLAQEPSASMLEHPVYGVRVAGCT